MKLRSWKMVMEVWKRVLETLCGLKDLLYFSQASLIALFTHATHADSIIMSAMACGANLFTHAAHADSIRMSAVACGANLFTHTAHADSIRMSAVACRVNLFTHTAHADCHDLSRRVRTHYYVAIVQGITLDQTNS